MSTPGQSSHATTWITVILAVFILYILSSGPVFVLGVHDRIPERIVLPLFYIYYPILVLSDIPPFDHLFEAYFNWWDKILIRP